jgi:hypothetical protein
METHIAKKSRFRIDELEERVAPGAVAVATTFTYVSGQQVLSVGANVSVNLSVGGVSAAIAVSDSTKVGLS